MAWREGPGRAARSARWAVRLGLLGSCQLLSSCQLVFGLNDYEGPTEAGGVADGTPCTDSGQCKSGFCVDGVCCQSACAELCHVCTTGRCEVAEDGTEDSACGAGGRCKGGHCKRANGDNCTPAEADDCFSGFCENNVCCAAEHCPGPCSSCNMSFFAGICFPVPEGHQGECDSTNVCTQKGDCKRAPGQSCSGDGDCASNVCSGSGGSGGSGGRMCQ